MGTQESIKAAIVQTQLDSAVSQETQESIEAAIVQTQLDGAVSQATQERVKAAIVQTKLDGAVSQETQESIKAAIVQTKLDGAVGKCVHERILSSGRTQLKSHTVSHAPPMSQAAVSQDTHVVHSRALSLRDRIAMSRPQPVARCLHDRNQDHLSNGKDQFIQATSYVCNLLSGDAHERKSAASLQPQSSTQQKAATRATAGKRKAQRVSEFTFSELAASQSFLDDETAKSTLKENSPPIEDLRLNVTPKAEIVDPDLGYVSKRRSLDDILAAAAKQATRERLANGSNKEVISNSNNKSSFSHSASLFC